MDATHFKFAHLMSSFLEIFEKKSDFQGCLIEYQYVYVSFKFNTTKNFISRFLCCLEKIS